MTSRYKKSIPPADCYPGYHCLECRYKKCIRHSAWDLDQPTKEESEMILCAKLPRRTYKGKRPGTEMPGRNKREIIGRGYCTTKRRK